MSREAATPPGFWQRVQNMIDTSVGKAMRAAPLRNTSLTDGNLTLAGGTLKLLSAEGDISFWLGSVTPRLPDGTYQPGWILYREDGTAAAALYDPDPSPDDYHQFLALYDRAQKIIVADDTDSGQGLSRPYISTPFYRTRYSDFTASSTSATFETLFDARLPKQHPKLEVGYRASMDTTATTGETRVMVNGVQIGDTNTEGFAVVTHFTGATAVEGDHMEQLVVEIQGRRTSASGTLRVEPHYLVGRQS